MPLIFVRHGSSVLNAGDSADPRDMFRGWAQVPLSEDGHKAARQTATWFRRLPVQMIVSSDLPRASETAEEIAKVTGAPVTLDPRLRPWHIGNLTGQVITPERKQLMQDLQVKTPNIPIMGGEAYNDFVQRYSSILPELFQAAQSQNVVMVAHHRNALSLGHILYNQPVKFTGPPEPGGVAYITDKGLVPVYTPPSVLSGQYAEKASS